MLRWGGALLAAILRARRYASATADVEGALREDVLMAGMALRVRTLLPRSGQASKNRALPPSRTARCRAQSPAQHEAKGAARDATRGESPHIRSGARRGGVS